MVGSKLLLISISMLLGTSAWCMDNTSNVQCAFSPHLQCSDKGVTLWSKPWIKDPTPIVRAGQHIYLSQNDTALSFNVRTGARAWIVHSGNDERYFKPVISKQDVYLARTDGLLEKRRKQNGTLLWAKALGKGWVYPPVTNETQLITAGQDRIIWMLDAKTGSILEQIPLSQELVAPLYRIGDRFIAATFDSKVSAYSIGQKYPDWQTTLENPVFNFYRAENSLIVADMDGNVSALNPQNGQPQWQHKVHKNAQFWNVLHQQTLYSLTDSGTLHILDANNGESLNSFNFERQFAQAPIVRDEFIALFDTKGSTLHVTIDGSNMNQVNFNNFH